MERLLRAIEQHDILRVKGFLAVAGKDMRLVVQAVGARLQHYYDRAWRADEAAHGKPRGHRPQGPRPRRHYPRHRRLAVHLLAAKPGAVSDGQRGRRSRPDARRHRLPLGGRHRARLPRPGAGGVAVRCAQPAPRQPPVPSATTFSVDKYVEDILQHARLVIVRLLGGARYWPYGIEQVSDCCRRRGIALAVLPGDDQPDPELTALSTLDPPVLHRLWQYCVQGGPANARNLLLYAAAHARAHAGMARARHSAARRTLLAWPAAADARRSAPSLAAECAVVPIVFYRALLQSGDLAVIDALCDALAAAGLNPLPVYVTSLKGTGGGGAAARSLCPHLARGGPERDRLRALAAGSRAQRNAIR